MRKLGLLLLSAHIISKPELQSLPAVLIASKERVWGCDHHMAPTDIQLSTSCLQGGTQ
jgi:hypothetical protein